MSRASDDDIISGALGVLFTAIFFIGFAILEIWLIYQGCTGGMELWVALVIAASLLVLSKFLLVLFLLGVLALVAIIAIPVACIAGLLSGNGR